MIKDDLKNDVTILTFWNSVDNYGQLLQAYALQQFLISEGCNPITLKYYWSARNDGKLKGALRFLYRKYNECIYSRMPFGRNFHHFRRKHLVLSKRSYYGLSELRDDPPVSAAYIVGSDQVWNPKYCNEPEAFYLKFGGEKVRRIAYAASMGDSEVPVGIRESLLEWLKDFDAIGIRESGTVDSLRRMGVMDAVPTPDPCLLLSSEQWSKLIPSEKESLAAGRPFIYWVNHGDVDSLREVIESIADMSDEAPVVVMAHGTWESSKKPSIPEWLACISSAKCIITNSFHCTVFSLIFQKAFLVVSNSKVESRMSGRMTDLLTPLGQEGRVVSLPISMKHKELLEQAVDVVESAKYLNDLRERGSSFLARSLSSAE